MTLEDLAPYQMITYDKGTPFGALIEQFYQEKGLPLEPIVEVGSPHSASALVQLGAGIALVDEFSVKWAPGKMSMRPLADSPVVQTNLVYFGLEPMSLLTRAFVDVLRDLVHQLDMGGEAGVETGLDGEEKGKSL